MMSQARERRGQRFCNYSENHRESDDKEGVGVKNCRLFYDVINGRPLLGIIKQSTELQILLRLKLNVDDSWRRKTVFEKKLNQSFKCNNLQKICFTQAYCNFDMMMLYFLRLVATFVFNVCLLQAVVLSKQLHRFEPMKTYQYTVNAG